jgi:hypothetical protein
MTAPTTSVTTTYQPITGSDNPGYNFPIKIQRQPTISTIHNLVNNPATAVADMNDYFASSIEEGTDHDGGTTKFLKQSILALDNGSAGQNWYEIQPLMRQDDDLYLRYWMMLPSDFLTSMGESPNWRSMFFFKTPGSTALDYRLEAYVYKNTNNGGDPYFFIHGDWFDDEQVEHEYWNEYSYDVAVPINEWFLMEFFIHRADDDTGRIRWAVNGVDICDRYGSLYGADGDHWNRICPFGIYSRPAAFPAYQYIDDVEIWSGIPAGAFTP